MAQEIIAATERFVQHRLAGESTGHDWWHAAQVRANALRIQEVEGGDLLVIELAALLHDVGDRKVLGREDDDPTIARNFLGSLHLGVAAVDAVMFVINNISYSKSLDNPELVRTLELDIVQDADRLTALGAIGIARAFAFGGSRGRPIYDPDYQAQEFGSSVDYKRAKGSSLHHFDEKLLRLKDTFNTPTGRALATERHDYMVEFKDRFLAEWNGQI